ncbi:MAG: tryptophan 7-halogenase [Alphaproteobacteria bacterium]|nr:tryptophan 7-halogenase [Alphaproteobacteria bacterium]MCB9794806.1 tryptophan 7-halogenase [Alphaproteobacteria bacterium]
MTERLGDIALLKPGLSFVLRDGRVLSFGLHKLSGLGVRHAYNVSRPQFDALLRERAAECGVEVIQGRAKLLQSGADLHLSEDTLVQLGLSEQPDFIVDASGAARLAGRAAGVRVTKRGPRLVCRFAHFQSVHLGAPEPGQAVLTPLDTGWCWRIPLQSCTSVGIVAPAAAWSKRAGKDDDKRLEGWLRSDRNLSSAMASAERTSPTRSALCQQVRLERLRGPNWAAIGDAAGFIDPALSPGVSIAMESAHELCDALRTPHKLDLWEQRQQRRLDVWTELVSYYYDGSLFAAILQGEEYNVQMPWLGPLNRHMERTFASALLGVRTMSWLHMGILRLTIQRGLRLYQPVDWAIPLA